MRKRPLTRAEEQDVLDLVWDLRLVVNEVCRGSITSSGYLSAHRLIKLLPKPPPLPIATGALAVGSKALRDPTPVSPEAQAHINANKAGGTRFKKVST